MTKPKYLITNVCYGQVYSELFLNQHLKSCLDETNLPDLVERYDVSYMILTDDETLPVLQQHPNMHKLSELLGAKNVHLIHFSWGDQITDKFGRRYSALLDMFKISVKKALEDKFDLLTCWVADLVVAKEFFSKVTKKIEEGHGAVFVLPARAAAESVIDSLEQWEGALPAGKLWKVCYENMHPLWWACHWENPCFSKLPFTLIWNNGKGLRVHSYSTTPIIFKPKQEMLADDRRGMIDGDIPELCDNPFWATNWTDAPVIGVEPLFCYYPTFQNKPASIADMKEWQKCVHPSQVKFLEKALYYPDEKTVGEIEVKDIPGQIASGYEPPAPIQLPPPEPEKKEEAPVKINREMRRLAERQMRK